MRIDPGCICACCIAPVFGIKKSGRRRIRKER
jgi:hypothetical protein